MKKLLTSALALSLCYYSAGCGTSTGGSGPSNTHSVGGTGNTNVGGKHSTSTSTNPNFFAGGSTSSNTSTKVDVDAGCAGDKVAAELTQVNILVLLDKSGSMGNQKNSSGDYDWENCDSRWNPVAETLLSFFSDSDSSRLYASLSFLPSDGDEWSICNVANYSSPNKGSIKVPLTLLDDAGRAKFTSRLCPCGSSGSSCITPSGGTPTLVALQGTMAYADSIRKQYPESKTVIVLLTDGDPGFGFYYGSKASDDKKQLLHLYSCNDLPDKTCADSATCASGCAATGDCADQQTEIDKVTQVISTAPKQTIYVAGVGDLSESTLDAWATASGNDAINLLNLDGPAAANMLRAKLESIRSSSINCKFKIPTNPNGDQINGDKTNVIYTSGAGVATSLMRTPDGTSNTCGSSDKSWYFDNPVAPTEINLCETTCKPLQQDAKGAIQVVYGCDTIVNVL